MEDGAFADLRLHADLASVPLHDAVHHRQPQPDAVLCFLGREEGFEYLWQHIGRDADTGIADVDLDLVGAAAQSYVQLPFLTFQPLHRLDRVD